MTTPVSHRILVIDDTVGIHEDFRKVFSRPAASLNGLDADAAALFGEAPTLTVDSTEFIIDSAFQGREGAEMVRAALGEGQPYSLAFVDMRMPPGWDGLETVQAIWKIDPRLQIVICTAHSDHSWHKIRSDLGPSDSLIILKKPFDQIEANQLAHALCQKWALTRQSESRLSQLDDLVRERTQELQVAEERFAQAFAANPHAQALIALEPFEVLEVNPMYAEQFGLTVAELKNQSPATFGRGIDPKRWQRLLDRLLAGNNIDEYPFVFERTPDNTRELRCSVRTLRIANRLCSIWLIRDVTDQHHLEQQFRQAQKMEAVGQLAAGIAHDFNNLLTVIQSYTGLMLDNDAASPAQKSELLQVRDAADRAAALTRQLLVFSRQQIAKPKPVVLSTALKSLREMLSRLLPERIRFDWHEPESSPKVMADTANFEQVVMNLVINARDATPRHGVITVQFESIKIESSVGLLHPKARTGLFLRVSVSDTGAGMSAETLSRIFEPFFTTKESGKGTGLGLSTVYGIVDQHDGWVEVTTRLGEGSTFHVYVPTIVGPTAETITPFESPLESTALRGRGERILIVEDDETVRSVASLIATRAGYSVTEASDGVTALSAWREAEHHFDLIFTDVVMPNGINGIDLAHQLRRDRPDVKVLFATGYSDELLNGARHGLGEVPLLLKPYTLNAVLTKLRGTLDSP